MDTNPLPVKIELRHAISLLKQGKTLEALKKFEFLQNEMNAQQHSDLSTAILNYSLSLNMIFDRNLAAAKESLYHDDELKTAVILVNLLNIYEILRNISSENDRVLQKKTQNFSQLEEKWILKKLGIIKSTEIQKRQFKKRFEDVKSDFEFVYSMFFEFFQPIIEEINKKQYNTESINKTIKIIYKEIGKEYINLAKSAIKKKNIINSIQILEKSRLIFKNNSKNIRIEGFLSDLQRHIDDLTAEYYLKAGNYYRNKNRFKESAKLFRKAYHYYRIQNEEDKQKKSKEDYLKTCVKFGQYNLKLANQFSKNLDTEDAILYFQKAIENFKSINAKKEYSNAIEQYNNFIIYMGDIEYKKGQKINSESLRELNQQINHFHNAMDMYAKAANDRKIKDCKSLLIRSLKQKMKILLKETQKAHRNKNFNYEFLVLEELHLLCYELDMVSKAQHYAEELEKLKPKVNLEQVEQLRKTKFDGIVNFDQKDTEFLSDKIKTQIMSPEYQDIQTVKNDLPNVFGGDLNTTVFIHNNRVSKNIDSKTTFRQPNHIFPGSQFSSNLFQETLKIQKFSSKHKKNEHKELKKVNQIVKKFNMQGFLEENEIQTLQMYGLNLPEQVIYYHKYPNSNYQFYVLKTNSEYPKVLLIPTKNVIKRKSYLGSIIGKIDLFINSSSEILNSSELLENHIKFALNHPKWNQIMEGFQYSTLDIYFSFLNALRLYSKSSSSSSFKEVAKFINSSLIAEYLNIPTEKLENKIEELKSVKYFEEIFSWSDNINYQLFFIGMYYFSRKKYMKASILWSKLLVS
ncbi:MAG: hypothetical protein ACTSQ5_08770 [Promethearchaeota archaeon]